MRVLLATDGSEDARTAAAWLTEFPLPPAARVMVVSVVTVPPSALDIPPVREFTAALHDGAHAVAGEAARILEHRRAGVETRVIEGDPREEIVVIARDWHADLVVVGARGLGAVKGLLLGSVSTTVLREAPCAVLVVKRGGRSPRTIVAAIDGSPDALAAADFLAALPLDPDTTVRLLAVVEPRRYPPGPTAALSAFILTELETLMAKRKAELTEVLTRVEPRFRDKVATVERTVVIGAPAEDIVSAASQPDVDLVVLGARGLGRIARFLVGSVSERVMHHAPCAVLVVKPPQR